MSKHTLLVLALFCFAVSAMLLLVSRFQVSGHLDELRSAPVLDAKSVRSAEPGRQFRLSATVDPSNESLYRDLVAYDVEEWRAGTGSSSGSWRITQSNRPPLLLRDLGADTITLRGDYLLLHAREFEVAAGRRYRGLGAGDTLGIYGTVATGSGGVHAVGERVGLGDALSMVSDQEEGMRIMNHVGLVAAGAGLLLLALHMRRRRGSAER